MTFVCRKSASEQFSNVVARVYLACLVLRGEFWHKCCAPESPTLKSISRLTHGQKTTAARRHVHPYHGTRGVAPDLRRCETRTCGPSHARSAHSRSVGGGRGGSGAAALPCPPRVGERRHLCGN